jgi:hypothetical protein
MVKSSAELINRSAVRPKVIYCCRYDHDQLLRTNLLTGEQSCHRVPGYQFKHYSTWSELPGGSLLITGGYPAVKEVVQIDALRESALSSQPSMRTARYQHAAVYHSQYLYVLGGYSRGALRECERYVCAESRWEGLRALPSASFDMSAVELGNSLYALGGLSNRRVLHSVQKLSLNSLTWELMQLKLPQAAIRPACFKTDSQVYLVIKETLYSFSPLEVKPVKTLPEDINSRMSDYSRGTLYYEDGYRIRSLAVGELTRP